MIRTSTASLIVLLVHAAVSRASYDAYPPGGSYVTGTAAQYAWGGENFESYTNGQVVEQSTNMAMQSHLDVTSGTLESKYAGSWRRGWTTTYNFRTVANGDDGSGNKIKWTDGSNQYRGYVSAWHSGLPDWSGLHAFSRYQNDDNLYVASLRYDGEVAIKSKVAGTYTTLASGSIGSSYLDANGHLKTGQWYTLKFATFGSSLKLYVDNNLLLTASDSSLTYGTIGIRTDYANVYLDDWQLLATNPEPASLMLLAAPAVVTLRRRPGRA